MSNLNCINQLTINIKTMNTLVQTVSLACVTFSSPANAANLPVYFYNQVFLLEPEEETLTTINYDALADLFQTESEQQLKAASLDQQIEESLKFFSLQVQVPIFVALTVLLIGIMIAYKKLTAYYSKLDESRDESFVTTISSQVSTENLTVKSYNTSDIIDEHIYENIAYKDSVENLLNFERKSTNNMTIKADIHAAYNYM